MNLDLLKKLTKLANHNPNENEANSAARRVCKMLEECNWNLTQKGPIAQKIDEINRATEAAWRGKSTEQARQHQQNVYEAQRQARQDWRTQSPFTGPNPFDEFFRNRAEQTVSRPDSPDIEYDASGKPIGKKKKPPTEPFTRPIMCSKCKQFKMTSFIGLPETFICQDCQWS